jgi:GDP-L-fucose synthase
LTSFLKGKRICLTGGSGFLGTNIKEYLRENGIEFSCPTRAEYDLTRPEDTERMLAKMHPDIILHAAADVGGIGYNRLYPADIFRNNLRMAVNILDAAARHKVAKCVLIGSACAYPGETQGKLKEDEFLNGPMHESVEVYGFSKRALYLGAKAYRKQYGLNSIFLLLTNLYGPHDKFDPSESHVVAALIRKFMEAARDNLPEVVCWGTGKPVREFLYSRDCAEAICLAAEKYNSPEPLNIGTGVGTTIQELAELLRRATGYKGNIRWDASKPDGAMKKVLDVSRMKLFLGWEPQTSLEDGLRKTIEWCKKKGLFVK